MNILSSVHISGLWGREIRLDFHRDVNLLIGVNGSGKTTIVDLIAAVLRADVSALNRTTFRTIRVGLSSPGGRKGTYITAEKQTDGDSPFVRYTFEIKRVGVRKKEKFVLHEGRAYSARFRPPELTRQAEAVAAELSQLSRVTWLSVHRSQTLARDEQHESLVDKKLAQVSNRLVRYLSLLTTRATTETENFQKAVFQSLVHQSTESNAFATVRELDLDEERGSLTEIFKRFSVDNEQSARGIQRQFSLVKDALDASTSGGKFSWDQLAATISMLRIHSIVQGWHSLVKKLQNVYEPRDQFLSTLFTLMPKKAFSINERNELLAAINGSPLPLKNLSSGEKQLIIILGEALLQDKTPCIYIADEPELSLHVTWQEQLRANLANENSGNNAKGRNLSRDSALSCPNSRRSGFGPGSQP